MSGLFLASPCQNQNNCRCYHKRAWFDLNFLFVFYCLESIGGACNSIIRIFNNVIWSGFASFYINIGTPIFLSSIKSESRSFLVRIGVTKICYICNITCIKILALGAKRFNCYSRSRVILYSSTVPNIEYSSYTR